MDIATAIATGRKVAKVANKVIKYVREDNSHFYGLDEDVTAVVTGEGVSPWAEGSGDPEVIPGYGSVTTADGTLSVEATGPGRVILVAHPFDASLEVWNGPDVLPDTTYRWMLASLFHDLIWAHRKELAAAFGRDVPFVLDWGTDVLHVLWVHASGNAIQRLEARIAWHVCGFAAPWYHSVKKILRLHCLPWLLGVVCLAGCATPPDWEIESIGGTNAVLRAMGVAHEAGALGRPPAGDSTISSPSGQVTPSSSSAASAGSSVSPGEVDARTGFEGPSAPGDAGASDAVDFSALDWCWGGIKGGGAQLVDGCRIGSLRVTSSGLSYKWEQGGCEKLGAASKTEASCVAALFCRISGKWVGGKFDWISTSRTSRDFKNISSGYSGWDKSAVSKADAFAFVIVSGDGSRRSTVAVQDGGAR